MKHSVYVYQCVRADLQGRQQVAGLSQSGSGGVQLLQQFVLRLLQRGDLTLGRPHVLLALLHLLLQPGHLRRGQADGDTRTESDRGSKPNPSVAARTLKLHQRFKPSEVELASEKSFK